MAIYDLIGGSLAAENFGTATALPLCMGDLATGTTSAGVPWQSTLTFSNLRCTASANSTNANSTLVFQDNAVTKNQSVSITSGTTGTFVDSSHTDAITPGNIINTLLTVGGSAGSLTLSSQAVSVNALDIRYGCTTAAGNISASNTTYFMGLAGGGVGAVPTSSEAITSVKIRAPGKLENAFFNAGTNTATNTATFKTRIAAANGLQAVSITGNTTGIFQDTASSHYDTITSTGPLVNFALVTGASTVSISGFGGVSFVPTYNQYPLIAGNFSGTAFTTGSSNYVVAGGTLTLKSTEALVAMTLQTAYVATYLFGYVKTNAATAGNTTVALRASAASLTNALSITHGTTGYFEDSTHSDSIASGATIDYYVVAATGGSTTFTSIGVHLSQPQASGAIVEKIDTVAGVVAQNFKSSGAIAEKIDTVAGVASAAGSSATITGAIVEKIDTVAGVVAETFKSSGAISENKDTVAGVVKTFLVSGAITEKKDTVAGVVAETFKSSGAITENRDTVAGTARVISISGTITEAHDIVAGVASASPHISGAVVENRDTVAGVAAITFKISGSITEARDTVAGLVKDFIVSGAINEGRDMVAGVVANTFKVSGSITEARDIVTGQASKTVRISAAIIDGMDIVAGATHAGINISGAITESRDTVTGAVHTAVVIPASGFITEKGDIAAGVASNSIRITAAIREAKDIVSAGEAETFQASGSIIEGGDRVGGITLVFNSPIKLTGYKLDAVTLQGYRIIQAAIVGALIQAPAARGTLVDNPGLTGYYKNSITVQGQE